MRYCKLVLGIALLAGFSTASHALIISPTVCTAVGDPKCVTSNENGGNDRDVFPVLGTQEYLWEVDLNDAVAYGAESGLLSQSYKTHSSIFETITEENAEGPTVTKSGVTGLSILHESGDSVSCAPNPCYLVVKDGAQEPARYLFNLALLGWNGKELLELENFWTGEKGAISHVALYSGISAVPVPTAAWLFGTALIGFIGLSRRTKV